LRFGPESKIEGVRPCYIISNVEETVGLVVQFAKRRELTIEKYSQRDEWNDFTPAAKALRNRWPETGGQKPS
jgi:hypothetical protein